VSHGKDSSSVINAFEPGVLVYQKKALQTKTALIQQGITDMLRISGVLPEVDIVDLMD
jgi:hypothetical protein